MQKGINAITVRPAVFSASCSRWLRCTAILVAFTFSWIASGLALAASNVPGSGSRIALVVGNSAYKANPLVNPVNDARDIAARLKEHDFEVSLLLNADQRAMEEAVRTFTRKLGADNTVGLFYFAGHGVESQGDNYLIPIGAEINDESEIKYEAVNAGRLLDGMDSAGNGLNLVVLDACRNNPYASRFRSASRGLGRMQPASGAMVLYATEPGKVALDGEGRNGVFTKHLLNAMSTPGVTVERAFKQTAQQVRSATGGKQTPWIEGVILGDFYFVEEGGAAAVPARPAPAQASQQPAAGQDKQMTASTSEFRTIDETPGSGGSRYSDDAAGSGEPRYIKKDSISAQRPRARLVLGSEPLTDQVAMVDVRIGAVGRLQRAEVSVQNLSDNRYTLEYQYSWEDEQGFSINQNKVWKRFVLGAREIKSFQTIGTHPDAYALTMTVRLPDDLFIHQEKTGR